MTTIDERTTLGELVTERPDLAPLLERFGLDYCCGGRRPVTEAITAAGLDVADTLAALESEAPTAEPADWKDYGPAELADHIESTHHAYLDDALVRLTALAEKVAGVHGGRHPELHDVRAALGELRAELEPHMRKEELVLFPLIRQLDGATNAAPSPCGSVRNPIAVMTAEHDRAGELLLELRTHSVGYETPPDGCVSYQALYRGLAELEADTHLHIHKENNLLFPAAVAAEQALRTPSR